MTLKQIMERINSYNGRIGDYDIETDELAMSKADFILGCYFDESKQKWVVYKNNERGMGSIRLETDDQKAAFDKLLSMIEFQCWLKRRI